MRLLSEDLFLSAERAHLHQLMDRLLSLLVSHAFEQVVKTTAAITTRLLHRHDPPSIPPSVLPLLDLRLDGRMVCPRLSPTTARGDLSTRSAQRASRASENPPPAHPTPPLYRHAYRPALPCPSRAACSRTPAPPFRWATAA